jgi:hypothetical protein
MRRLLAALPLLWLAAGCPSSTSGSCPTATTPSGDFTLTLALQGSEPQCRVIFSADGGPADGDVAAAPAAQSATICAGKDDAGVPSVFLAAANRTVSAPSKLAPDDSFAFSTTSTGVSGTVCGCVVNILEQITGTFVPTTPGPIQLAPDGGLTPPVASFSGTLVDTLSSTATGCLCNISGDAGCNLTYQLAGTRQ